MLFGGDVPNGGRISITVMMTRVGRALHTEINATKDEPHQAGGTLQ